MLGSGSRLPPGVQADFESRLGTNFQSVRIHTNDRASAAAKSLDARAFTHGEHIAFARNQYNPASVGGRALLAHELVHVMQQRGDPGRLNGLTFARRREQSVLFGMASSCWIPGTPSSAIGGIIHNLVEAEMMATYPGLFSEVEIPYPLAAPGRVDLFWDLLPGIVPATPQLRIRPRPGLQSPPFPLSPQVAFIGEIKPATNLVTGQGFQDVAEVLDYSAHHNLYYRMLGRPIKYGTWPMLFPVPAPLLAPGIPLPSRFPQMLQAITPFDGVYYYFCRPMAAVPVALYWLVKKIDEILGKLGDKLKELGGRVEALARQAWAGIVAAYHAVAEFFEKYGKYILAALLVLLLIVVAVILIITAPVWVPAVGTALAGAAAAVAAGLATVAEFSAEAAVGAAAVMTLMASSPAAAGEPAGGEGEAGPSATPTPKATESTSAGAPPAAVSAQGVVQQAIDEMARARGVGGGARPSRATDSSFIATFLNEQVLLRNLTPRAGVPPSPAHINQLRSLMNQSQSTFATITGLDPAVALVLSSVLSECRGLLEGHTGSVGSQPPTSSQPAGGAAAQQTYRP
jgi:hypothetical protein